jgi:CRP/FNR family cyclic AMP-dependent transcriptional regulator
MGARNRIAIAASHAALMTDNRTPARVFELGTACAVAAGRDLTKEGTPGREAFFVLEGTARVTAEGHVVAHIGPGDFVGEFALIDAGPRSATVTAESPMRVLAFDAPAFASLLDDPQANRTILRVLVARLRSSIDTTNRRNEQ